MKRQRWRRSCRMIVGAGTALRSADCRGTRGGDGAARAECDDEWRAAMRGHTTVRAPHAPLDAGCAGARSSRTAQPELGDTRRAGEAVAARGSRPARSTSAQRSCSELVPSASRKGSDPLPRGGRGVRSARSARGASPCALLSVGAPSFALPRTGARVFLRRAPAQRAPPARRSLGRLHATAIAPIIARAEQRSLRPTSVGLGSAAHRPPPPHCRGTSGT